MLNIFIWYECTVNRSVRRIQWAMHWTLMDCEPRVLTKVMEASPATLKQEAFVLRCFQAIGFSRRLHVPPVLPPHLEHGGR